MLSCREEANYIVDVDDYGEEDGNSTWLMLTENARAQDIEFIARGNFLSIFYPSTY